MKNNSTDLKQSLKNIVTISKKELRAFFDNPTAYIVLIVFLLLWEFLFFRGAFLIGEASIRSLFDFLLWLYLILIPAITMGTIAQERKDGTLEFMLTRPIREYELIIGKFVGNVIFVAIALLFIFPIAYSFSQFGELDWGVVWGQYLGSLLAAAVLVALGIFVSSLVSSQISAMLIIAVSGFMLTILGYDFFLNRFPLSWAQIFEQLSLSTHFQSTIRGIVDLRDMLYYFTLILTFLSFSFLAFLKRKIGKLKKDNNQVFGVALVVGIAILLNILIVNNPKRWDLTQNKVYTLSGSTKQILAGLDDVVNITLFASQELPAQFQPTYRETKDLLTDYQSLAGGNIDFSVKDPSRDDEALTESMSVGVEKVQFNVVSNEEFQVKNGYLGLVVSYGGEHETIPFVSNTSDLEYQVTSFIHKLTVKDKKQIGFLRSFGAKDISQMQGINGELEKQFKITTVTAKPKEDPAKEKEELPEGQEEAEEEKEYTLEIEADIDLLVISGNEEKISGQPLEEIKKFMENGGSVIFLVDTVNINDQSFTAMANENSLAGFIDEELGVKVKDNLVYDLRSNQTVSFSGGAMNYLLPYPFWTEVVPQKEKFPAFSDLETVGLTWASTISFDEGKANDKGYEVLEILRTTKFAGTKSNTASILPNSEFSKESLEEKLVGVALKNSDTGSRVIVVGDSDFVTDRFSRNRPQNIVFMTSLSSWLTQAQSLTDIQSKARVERKLKFERDGQMAMIKFGNMAFALLVPLTIGGWRIMRRKKLQTREYE